MKIYKWKKIKSETEYDGKRVKIRKDYFQLPTKKITDFSVIERGSVVAILPITQNGEIIFVEQYRPAVDSITLDIPGGAIHLREKETPLQAAQRELLEEVGYKAKKVKKLGTFYSDSGRSDQIRHIFIATDLVEKSQQTEEMEYINIRKIKVAKVLEMITKGSIKEPTAVLSVLLYFNNIRKF